MLPALDLDTTVNHPEWKNGGGQRVLSLKESIYGRDLLDQSDKCLMVTRGMFDYEIDRWCMHPHHPDMGPKQAKSSNLGTDPTLE